MHHALTHPTEPRIPMILGPLGPKIFVETRTDKILKLCKSAIFRD